MYQTHSCFLPLCSGICPAGRPATCTCVNPGYACQYAQSNIGFCIALKHFLAVRIFPWELFPPVSISFFSFSIYLQLVLFYFFSLFLFLCSFIPSGMQEGGVFSVIIVFSWVFVGTQLNSVTHLWNHQEIQPCVLFLCSFSPFFLKTSSPAPHSIKSLHNRLSLSDLPTPTQLSTSQLNSQLNLTVRLEQLNNQIN